jgi:hypothetical protein
VGSTVAVLGGWCGRRGYRGLATGVAGIVLWSVLWPWAAFRPVWRDVNDHDATWYSIWGDIDPWGSVRALVPRGDSTPRLLAPVLLDSYHLARVCIAAGVHSVLFWRRSARLPDPHAGGAKQTAGAVGRDDCRSAPDRNLCVRRPSMAHRKFQLHLDPLDRFPWPPPAAGTCHTRCRGCCAHAPTDNPPARRSVCSSLASPRVPIRWLDCAPHARSDPVPPIRQHHVPILRRAVEK